MGGDWSFAELWCNRADIVQSFQTLIHIIYMILTTQLEFALLICGRDSR